MAFFLYQTLLKRNTTKYGIYRVIQEIYTIGVTSLFFISCIAIFTGFIITLQSYYTLLRFGATFLLGNAIAITLVRELAPVLTALMLIARTGSAITSQLTAMRLHEHINALHVHNIPPNLFLVRPLFFAFLLSAPLLTYYFIFIALFSGAYFASSFLALPLGMYRYGILEALSFSDIVYTFCKSFVFSFLIASISTYIGYFSHILIKTKGAYAIRQATTRSVVLSSIIILLANYVLSSFFFTR